MTDREQLEFAAKAAGIKGWYEPWYRSFIKDVGCGGGVWDPLAGGDDLAALKAHLRIQGVSCPRAIVRAAAEIGLKGRV